MSAVEKVVDLGAKIHGVREWRHAFPIFFALFCSGLTGLLALFVGVATCVNVSISALMTCVGMVAFSGVLLFFPKRRRFYALADRLKPVAEAAAELLSRGATHEASRDDWNPFMRQMTTIEAELRVVGFPIPPVRFKVTERVTHMPWEEFRVWGRLLVHISVYARERGYREAMKACRQARHEYERATGESPDSE